MEQTFYKYQGTGNDFIMIDNRNLHFDKTATATVKRLCDRRLGIGADGLILIQDHPDFDFEMVYFNADGNIGSMCGNGGRCAVKFARRLTIISDEAYFLAADGDHHASVESDVVFLKMANVTEIEQTDNAYYLKTGSPHYVQFVDNLHAFEVFNEGKNIRNNNRFKEVGTNVNFAEILPDNTLFVRTYERGVEDETLSCGTGVTATALAAHLKGFESPVKIKTLGGELQVSFEKDGDLYHNIYLSGPAKMVFKGHIEIV